MNVPYRMNPPFSDKILLLLGSKSITPTRSLSRSPSLSPSYSPSATYIPVVVQGSQGSNLLLVIAVPIGLIAAFLLAVVVFQAVYYNRRRVHQPITEVPLPAISMSPILRPQAQVFDANDPCILEDPPFTTENPMHKNVAI
jgi:hypothetical protein